MKGRALEQMAWTVAYKVLDFCPLPLEHAKAARTLSLQNAGLHASLGSYTAIPHAIKKEKKIPNYIPSPPSLTSLYVI